MREWWRSRPPEVKRAYLDKRPPEKPRPGRKPGPRVPEKEAARRYVYSAVRSGRMVRQPCEVCGAEKVDAHHDDYTKPHEVRWLCRPHHGREHRIYEDVSTTV